MNKDTPVTLGVEVEAQYPIEFPTPKVREAAETFVNSWYIKGYGHAPERINPATGLHERGVSPVHFLMPHPRVGAKTVAGRAYASHDWEKEVLPEEYRSPLGWERGWEVAHEFRFMGPAATIKDAFERYDNLQKYMDAWKIVGFQGCGTHIHMGVVDWINKTWPKNPAATNLLYGYIASRAFAMAPVISLHRQVAVYPFLRATTPLLEIHNYANDAIKNGGWHYLQYLRKGIPTFEARMFAATNVMDAVKGYTALLVHMLKRAESKMTKEFVSEFKILPAGTTTTPTKGFFGEMNKYTVEHLKDDIRELGWWSAPLISWIDETLKRNGEPTPFEGSLHEIYDNNTGTTGGNVVPMHDASAPRAAEAIRAAA